jgi:hypothetical protein
MEDSARKHPGVLTHVVDIAIALLVVGALLTWYGHYHAPFATPQGPVRWQNLAAVPLVAWLDVRSIAAIMSRPEVIAVAVLPQVLVAAFAAIARSRMRRWLRIVCHGLAGLVFVVGSIAVIALLRLQSL